VKFFSVRDPTKICTYISEVQDAGPLGPLFKVSFFSPLHVCLSLGLMKNVDLEF
jgi:hypothetical protein